MESAVTRGLRRHESTLLADKNLSPAAAAMSDVARPAITNLRPHQRGYLLSHRVRNLDARHFGLVLEMVAFENNSSNDIKVFNKAVRLTIAWGRESAQRPIYQFQISTYNVVPYTCPLFKACRALNCAEVYQLFAHGLASPHDRAFHDGLYLSPIDEIVNVVARTRTHAESVEGLSLLKFLFEAGAHPAVRPEGVTEIFMDCSSFRPQIYQEQDIDRLESLQVLLEYGEDTILEGTGVAGFLTVENEQVPVFGYLSPTEDWRINWEQMPYCSSERIFGETDRTMLLDPECKRIKAAISDGKEYVAFHPEFIIDKKLYLIGPLHSLILQASRSQLYEVHEYCRLRISILLRHGLDPRTPCWLFDERGNRRLEVSPTRYAQDLGSMDLWTDALKMSGWDEAEIETLIDEETYAGISGLLSGTVSYLDRDTCRRAFLRRLRAGDFRRMAHEILEDECKTLQFNLGLWDFQSIVEMVQNSSIEYFIRLTKRIPGSWLDDGGTMDILHEPIPGVDYELPQWSIDGDLIDWSKYLDDSDTQDVGNDMQEEGTDEDHLQEELEDDDDEDESWHDALSDEAEITGATQRRTIWGFNDV